MLLELFFLVFGFIVLIKSADILVDGASALAQKFAIPQIVIGLTIVAFGTSAPELVVNIISSIKHHSELCFGNILGSNIMNTLVILGVAALIMPLEVKKNTVTKEIPFLFIATVVTFILVNNFGLEGSYLSRIDAFILFGMFLYFLYYAFFILKNVEEFQHEVHKYSLVVSILLVIAGIAGLFLGGKLVVTKSVNIAHSLGISEKLIGLTVVALGTSLPELITSIVAVYKKKPDIAVGNVIGSNIFNMLMVLGISGMINPISYDVALNKDFTFLVFITFVLFITMFIGKKHKIGRYEGGLFLLSYIIYLVLIIIRK